MQAQTRRQGAQKGGGGGGECGEGTERCEGSEGGLVTQRSVTVVSRQSKGFTRPVDAKRVIHADGWHKAGFLGQGCHGGYFQEELMRVLREVPPNTELENMRVLVVHVCSRKY